jgi:hypothetical protein
MTAAGSTLHADVSNGSAAPVAGSAKTATVVTAERTDIVCTTICTIGGDLFPPVGDGGCCDGELQYGPAGCTCWRPVYDLEQQPVDEDAQRLLAAGVEPVTRRLMCGDCAYRPDSPEKSGDETYEGDAEFLDNIAQTNRQFWCHQGMRIPLKWVHPAGIEIPGHPGAYRPPIVDNVPYRADGTPAELCAGWAARRRALVAVGEALPDEAVL